MAGEGNKAAAAAPTNPAAAPAAAPAPGQAGSGNAADSNPATKSLGAIDQTGADDFTPRQAKAAQRAPATTVGSAAVASGGTLGGPLHEDDQVVRGRGKPGEQGKPLEDSEVGRFTFPITVHAPGPDHIPYKFSGEKGQTDDGHYQAHEYPPGAVVKMALKEGRALVARFGGTELKPGENPPNQPAVVVNDRGPEGPEAEKAKKLRDEADAGVEPAQSHQANG